MLSDFGTSPRETHAVMAHLNRMKELVRRLWRALQRVIRGSGSPEFSARYDPDIYELVPKGQYDYVPKGQYVFGPRSQFLLVPKNRYAITLLPGQSKRENCGVGWVTEDNTAASYDLLWGDEKALTEFRSEGDGVRTRLTEEIADHAAPLIRGAMSAVDIGCGVGDLLVALRQRCPDLQVSGCDFSPKAIEKAKANLQDGHFIVHAITSLPYPDASFDLVLCTDTLEHMEYPGDVLRELVRICKPGGHVCVVVPDGDVDDFLGHRWFWSEASLSQLCASWGGVVHRLPITREIMAIMGKRLQG